MGAGDGEAGRGGAVQAPAGAVGMFFFLYISIFFKSI
jgi:hypothetical protein